MKLMLDNPDFSPSYKIKHSDKLFFIGSCFADSMSHYFAERKFSLLQNPFGVLYNPVSIAYAIDQIATHATYQESDFFEQDKIFGSWYHHSNLSKQEPAALKASLEVINQSAFSFLQRANVAFVTLGTAWAFYHKEKKMVIANNHRAPASLFEKKLLFNEEIIASLKRVVNGFTSINQDIKIVFTVSPVRHTRQGLIKNNRSKVRLLEAVHAICEDEENCMYFPSYEILIDVLRDYRFYEKDLVHPNKLATGYVWEFIQKHFIKDNDISLLEELHKLHLATKHKIRHLHSPKTNDFKQEQLLKIKKLLAENPYLDLSEEKAYFEVL